MDEAPPLDAQIDALQCVLLSRKAWLERRAELISQGKKVNPDTGLTEYSIGPLEAALESLEFLRDNMPAILKLL